MTQEQLAGKLGISFQSVSKWENGQAYPDVELLPVIASIFHTSIDALMGYQPQKLNTTNYEQKYRGQEYYWGNQVWSGCYEVLKQIPPIRPLRLLDIGCGEGQAAVFFAKNGYLVSAFDVAESGIEKGKPGSCLVIIMTGAWNSWRNISSTATVAEQPISTAWM